MVDDLKNKLNIIVDRFIFSRTSIAAGIISTMAIWLLLGLSIAYNEPLRISLVLIDILVITVLVADEMLYQYFLRLELKLRQIIKDEALILPRHFETEHLVLRELKPSDRSLIRLLSSDQSLTNFVDDIAPNLSFKESRRWLIDHLNLERTSLRCTRIIERKDTGQSLGAVVIINGHELEYWLKQNYRGKGIAYEAVNASVDIIEKEENIVLFSNCSKSNEKSINLLFRLGFRRDDMDLNGKIHWIYDKRL